MQLLLSRSFATEKTDVSVTEMLYNRCCPDGMYDWGWEAQGGSD